MSSEFLVLPRPGTAKPGDTIQSIPAPSESTFTSTFGAILPPASYLQTPHGRAAYYTLPCTPPALTTPAPTPAIQRVLLIHGIQTPALGLHPLAHTLSTRFPSAQCVLFDHWGHGLSDTPLTPHSPSLFHSLIETLLDKLGWENAHLIGYSFGGSTLASFAAAKPERVSSMVLIAPAGLIPLASFSEVEKSYLRGGEGVEEASSAWILNWLEGGPLRVPADWEERVGRGEVVAEAVKEWELREHRGHRASVVAIFRDGGAFDVQAEFAFAKVTGFGIRNLCILGEKDDICSVRDLNELGFGNVIVVPNAGHAVVRERVPEVAGLIEKFWKTL